MMQKIISSVARVRLQGVEQLSLLRNPRGSTNTKTAGKSPFTLIELLVVVSIILILIGILLPSLKRAQMTARTLACKGNIATHAKGAMMYIADWNGALPPYWYYGGNPTNYHTDPFGSSSNQDFYYDFIYPYVKTSSPFLCQSRNKKNYAYYNYAAWGYKLQDFVFKASQLRLPSQKYWTYDNGSYARDYYTLMTSTTSAAFFPGSSNYFATTLGTKLLNVNEESREDFLGKRHGRSINASFFDGHAETITADKVCRHAKDGNRFSLTSSVSFD